QRLFKWGMARGHMRDRANPAEGLETPPEAGEIKMPSTRALAAVMRYVRSKRRLPPRAKGAVPSYLLPLLVIAYRCRLRGIEVLTLTEADATPAGIHCRRRKGSKA